MFLFFGLDLVVLGYGCQVWFGHLPVRRLKRQVLISNFVFQQVVGLFGFQGKNNGLLLKNRPKAGHVALRTFQDLKDSLRMDQGGAGHR